MKVSSVNRHACLAMQCRGGGLAELETFCGVTDLPPPIQKLSFNKIQKAVRDAATTVLKTTTVWTELLTLSMH